jgi:hypothetical protein
MSILKARDGHSSGHRERVAGWRCLVGCGLKKTSQETAIMDRAMAPRKIGPVTNLREFMESVWTIDVPVKEMLIYRGQADDWPLLPKLFRRSEKRVEILRQLESMLLDRFRNGCFYLLPSVPEGWYDLMSLGQHYGLDTRLLDWSRNPLMALFFAVDAPNPPTPTVYVYDSRHEQLKQGFKLHHLTDISEPTETLLFTPTSHSLRVVAQAGLHTVHSMRDDRHILGMERSEDAERITIISIDPAHVFKIRWDLKAMGIHSATVYGDLASIVKEIHYTYDPVVLADGLDDNSNEQ